MKNDEVPEGCSQPNRVWLTYGRKVNLGNYESVDISMGMSTDLEPGESVRDAITRCGKEIIPVVKGHVQKLRDDKR